MSYIPKYIPIVADYTRGEKVKAVDYNTTLNTIIEAVNYTAEFLATSENFIGPPGADGEDGPPGPAGEDASPIVAAEFVGDNLKFIKEDADFFYLNDAAIILKGDPGEQGIQGLPGEDGADAAEIISVEFSEDDMLFTKDDETTFSLSEAKTALKGADGEPGADGAPGEDGADAAEIISVEFSENDMLFTKEDETTFSLSEAKTTLKGEDGADGDDGILVATGSPQTPTHFWFGTQDEYDLVDPKDEDTIYYILEEV